MGEGKEYKILDAFEDIVCGYEERTGQGLQDYLSRSDCNGLMGILRHVQEMDSQQKLQGPIKALCEDLTERIADLIAPLNPTHFSYAQQMFERHIADKASAQSPIIRLVNSYN